VPNDTSSIIPVKHIAKLANIPITESEEKMLAATFAETLQVVEELKKVDVSGVEPTFQVTGLENVMREDVVDVDRMFSQDEALTNATASHNGYFVVPQIINQD